jgi:hypothetical protein
MPAGRRSGLAAASEMNVQRGLERVSAVWWGMWGLMAAGMLIAGVVGTDRLGRGEMVASGAGGLVACYVAHRITCWIVAGFFGPRTG